MYTDADVAALYDLMYPWDPQLWPSDRYYLPLVLAAESVLDVGCGTGGMLRLARERGHRGRLAGLDPDRAALDRARRRADVEWIAGTAADAPAGAGFALATMTGHAFQCLVADDEVRASLAAVRAALRPGGCFVFETRHPQARAWEAWAADDRPQEVTDAAGRLLRVRTGVEAVDGDVVTLSETVTGPDGTLWHTGTERLRFLTPAALDALLAGAGFTVEERYGDWDGGPVGPASREIVTVARR